MSVARVTAVPRPPDRAADSHKGDFGRVLVVAGSRGMAGAAALCGLGALRGGAGLVTVACPASLANTVTAIEPGLMTIPLPEEDGHVADPYGDSSGPGWMGELLGDGWGSPDWNVIAVGPGLGDSEEARYAVRDLVSEESRPVVVDADGLNALAKQKEEWRTVSLATADSPAPRVLTPHPGEFQRLLGGDLQPERGFEWTPENRETLAVTFAAEHNVVLLLKGHRTLVTDGERLFENRTGNAGMATGGAGDVLTGLLAALIGQGMDPFDAACCAAHLHGRAGDLAAAELSQPGLIASDLPLWIAKAFADPGY